MNIISFCPIHNISTYPKQRLNQPTFKAEIPCDVFEKSNPYTDVELRTKSFAKELYETFNNKDTYSIDNIKKLIHQYSKRTSVKNEVMEDNEAIFEQGYFIDSKNKVYNNAYKIYIDFGKKDKKPTEFYLYLLHEMIHNFQQKDSIILMNNLYNKKYSHLPEFNQIFLDSAILGTEEADEVIGKSVKSKKQALSKLDKICNQPPKNGAFKYNKNFEKYIKIVELSLLKDTFDNETQAYSLSSNYTKKYFKYDDKFSNQMATYTKQFSDIVDKKLKELQL